MMRLLAPNMTVIPSEEVPGAYEVWVFHTNVKQRAGLIRKITAEEAEYLPLAPDGNPPAYYLPGQESLSPDQIMVIVQAFRKFEESQN